MTPRVVATRRPPSSFEEYRADGDFAAVATRAFWNYALAPGLGIEGGDVVDVLRIDPLFGQAALTAGLGPAPPVLGRWA